MKKYVVFIMILMTCSFSACAKDNDLSREISNNTDNNQTPLRNMKLKMTIGNNTLTAILSDNPTARDFITLLPLTVKIDDYVKKEKVFTTERKLSTKDAPAGIDPDLGDITYYAPWVNIAIFYKDHTYSSGLIHIAKIDSGIEFLQVSGSIEDVFFELIDDEEN